MARNRPNRRGVKRHRSYTVDHAARVLGVAKGTVRRWLKGGLPGVAGRRPVLILGADLAEFLDGRRARKQTCELHECYCFTCRAPRAPAGDMADFIPLSSTSGNLRARCCTCIGVMHTAPLQHLERIVS
jgi:excisionase family DNA binding protein